ncbi:uncharacterized protein [Rutidosis leptorrhynchoides]|uniref:uncharacterized protein n=1 Tax=Rutidosis leptorrhynchoides TaxID=125765 RepID=UPI003A9960E5
MRFHLKWVAWICACLVYSRASLLINGSPSEEFSIERGLRLGDPLSPFLFIIGMEGLQAAINDAFNAALYSGIRVGNPSYQVTISNCLFADDVLFVGEWNDENAYNLLAILACFSTFSGLKINLQKSSLFGLGVDSSEVNRMANLMGCSVATTPFIFLGILIGQNMNHSKGWTPIIEKVKKRLNSWKNRTSSVASRFSNGAWLWFWRRPPRGGVEDSEFTELCEALHWVSLSAVLDHWTWDNPPDNTFTVAQARRLIENLNSVSTSTFSMWCKTVPIKINIFIWRLNLGHLPTIPNLEHRDIFVDRNTCALCDVSEESRNHLFIRCDTGYQIWCKVGIWLDVSIPILDSVEELWSWINSLPQNGNKRFIVKVVAISTLWHIWRLRNSIIFNDHNIRKSYVFDYIVLSAFN